MNVAILVAGGSGVRMGGTGGLPKQFLPIGGRPVLVHTCEAFVRHPEIDRVAIGINPDWYEECRQMLSEYFPDEAILLVRGGADRNETLVNVIRACHAAYGLGEADVLLTHDAVRPFVTEAIITENIAGVKRYGVVSTMLPATDTIVEGEDGIVTGMPDRSRMYQCQTPQSFLYGLFQKTYETLTAEELASVTDAAKLFFLRKIPVHFVPGDSANIKITRPIDLALAEYLLQH